MNKLRWHIWQTDDAISVIHLTTYFADFADLTVKCPPCESYYRWALLCWCPCQLLSCPLIFSSWRIWHSHRSPWLLVILSLHPGCRAVAVNKFWILSDYVGSFFCSRKGTMWPCGLILDVPWMQLLLVVNGCLVCVRESLTIRTQGEKRWILSQCHSLEIICTSSSTRAVWIPTMNTLMKTTTYLWIPTHQIMSATRFPIPNSMKGLSLHPDYYLSNGDLIFRCSLSLLL